MPVALRTVNDRNRLLYCVKSGGGTPPLIFLESRCLRSAEECGLSAASAMVDIGR
jgi:hypothetical protein